MANPPRLPAAVTQLGAPVVQILPLPKGPVAVVTGDGRVRFMEQADVTVPVRELVQAHEGALLSAAPAPGGKGVLTGGDDGRLVRTGIDGEAVELAAVPRRWIAAVVSDPIAGNVVFAAGKEVRVLGKDGREKAVFANHPSTVAALALDPKGKRLATAHYGGVSIWWVELKDQEPKRLTWKGSHLKVLFDPTGRYLVTTLQENELHGWRLADFQDMRMSGYPAKPRDMAFSPDGKKLASGGSDTVVVWDFTGKGPMGKAPDEYGDYGGSVATAVAFHPTLAIAASGHADGRVQLVSFGAERTIPLDNAGAGMVTALRFNADGTRLYAGTEDGGLASYVLAG